jgi:uncharacterized protein YciI
MDFEEFQLAILRQPADMPAFEPEALKASQEAHRDYLTSLRDTGQIISNGAILGHSDPKVRGLVLYTAGSVDEAQRLAEQDPAVLHGRLVPEVVAWRLPVGTQKKAGTPVDGRGA